MLGYRIIGFCDVFMDQNLANSCYQSDHIGVFSISVVSMPGICHDIKPIGVQ